jgi:hypothetical protein
MYTATRRQALCRQPSTQKGFHNSVCIFYSFYSSKEEALKDKELWEITKEVLAFGSEYRQQWPS